MADVLVLAAHPHLESSRVNRALQSLQELGAIRREGEVWQLDLPSLRAAADPEA